MPAHLRVSVPDRAGSLAALTTALASAGANVVSVTVYMKDLHEFRAMDSAYETYFRGALPARSVVEVTRIPRDARVEIAVIAGR